jgi:hypothetical protein
MLRENLFTPHKPRIIGNRFYLKFDNFAIANRIIYGILFVFQINAYKVEADHLPRHLIHTLCFDNKTEIRNPLRYSQSLRINSFLDG